RRRQPPPGTGRLPAPALPVRRTVSHGLRDALARGTVPSAASAAFRRPYCISVLDRQQPRGGRSERRRCRADFRGTSARDRSRGKTMNIPALSTRTHRTTGRRACALAAGVLAALLATTACQPGSADDAGGPGPATSAAKSGEPGAAQPDTGTAQPDGGAAADQGAGKADGAAGGQGAGADRKVPDCTPEHLAVSAVKEPADSKEARHLLVTVQNTGDTPCNLHRYPYLR